MTLEVVGLSYETSSLVTREKVAVPDDVLPESLVRMRRECGLGELAVLSTCNRVEFWFRRGAELLTKHLASAAGLSAEAGGGAIYHHRGASAAEHLFSVAAGLSSMVLGETEVLSQCKVAYETALAAGTTGPTLNAAFQRAFVAAKRVHSQTQVSRGRTSIGSIAAALVRNEFGSLKKRSVLVIGAGTMGRNALANISRLKPDSIVVANRSLTKGRELATDFGGRAARLSSVEKLLAKADVVVASAASPSYILTAEAARTAQKSRGGQPCVVIDIAVPRNVEPAAGEVEGVRLFNIDSLQEVAGRNVAARKREVSKARRIIRAEAGKLEAYLAQREVVPLVTSLQEKTGTIVAEEINTALGNLKKGSNAADEVRKLGERLGRKFLHGPVSALKKSVRSGEAEALSKAARTLYRLGDNGQT